MENIEIKTEPGLTIKQEEPQLSPLTDHFIKSEEIELKQELPGTSPIETYHRCPECLFKSKRRWSLQKHIKRHHPDLMKDHKPFKCTSCRYSAASKANLLKHFDVCHKEKLECRFCHFQTKFTKKLTVHVRMKHEMDENKKEVVWERCSKCFFRTKDKIKLERHVRVRHKVEKELFSCTLCDFKSTSLYNCKVHRRKAHPENLRYDCDYCFYSTKEKNRLENHLIKQHLTSENVVWYKCKNCRFKSSKKRELTNHCCQSEEIKSENIEVEQLKDLDVNFRFVCDKCDYKTNISGEYKSHQRGVHTENINWLECDQCEFKTKQKGNLTKHVDAKHVPLEKIKWIQCPHCAYRAKTRDLYKKHQSYKHADFFKWFKCDHCDFTTKRNYALKTHVTAKHSSEDKIKWYECAQCDYRGKTKDLLKQHRSNMHEVNKTKFLKTFECEFCGHACSRRNNLNRHVKMQHSNLDEIRWFKCELCSYKTKWGGDLKRHAKCKHG